jgi:hypothetical protein
VVLELSPRLGGNSITALVRLATGVDLAAAAVAAALGERRALPGPPVITPSAVVLLGSAAAGRLAYDAAARARLEAEPWVAALELEPIGTPVRPFVDGRAVVGRAFVTGGDRGEVDARAQAVEDALGVRAT